MIYNQYGKTGMKVSAIGFGGMRFDTKEGGNIEKNAGLLHYAFEKGITYFDTAPGYCDDYSEKIFGAAFATMKRDSFVVSTKCGLWNARTADEMRARLEQSLKTLGVDYIDIYNMWCIKDMDDYKEYMKKGGVYEGMMKAQEEGLFRHLCITTHAGSKDIADIAKTGLFEGVTLGYNAINFAYRQEGVNACIAQNMGVVTMNPLGGGIIPQNPDHFSFIRLNEADSIVVAALKFIISQPGMSVALVGFNNKREIDEAVLATENLYAMSDQYIKEQSEYLQKNLNALCTTCGYCNECPVDVPIPQLMDSYNYYILWNNKNSIANHMKWHWGMDFSEAAKCIECGKCETLCTQKLPIVERLQFIKEICQG